MIGVIFTLGNELLEVRIDENNLLFRTKETQIFYPIENLRIDKAGAIKENPDLVDDENWREKTIQRLKEKIKGMGSDMERKEYIITEMKKMGYTPYAYQRQGHRPVMIKDGN